MNNEAAVSAGELNKNLQLAGASLAQSGLPAKFCG